MSLLSRDAEPRSSREPHAGPPVAVAFLRWLGLVGGVLGGAVVVSGGLDFPPYLDERQFWRQTEFFAALWPPSLEAVRSYPEPMTPLSFLLWGFVEAHLGGGIAVGRLVNLLLSAALLALVGLRTGPRSFVALLCAAGLLLFPYTVPLSIHLYTDVPAAFFVGLGFWLYARRHPVASASAFALAIATRQYMVTFPLALAAAELAPLLLGRARFQPARTLPMLAAGASLGAWALFFEGLAPAPGLDTWPRHVVALGGLVPGYGLHLLTCVGAFFVVPEWIFFRRRGRPRDLISPRSLTIAGVVALAFLAFHRLSPDVELGALNRFSLMLLPRDSLGGLGVLIRQVLFAVLAWLTCLRFARVDLVSWVLFANFLLMFAGHKGWEKYHLPVMTTLWMLRSIHDLDRPLDLWNARRESGETGT